MHIQKYEFTALLLVSYSKLVDRAESRFVVGTVAQFDSQR